MLGSPSNQRHRILAHRGLWDENTQPNSADALLAAWREGFGVETDLRDFGQQIVISHDIPDGDEIHLDELISLLVDIGSNPGQKFAANIKADGLEKLLKDLDWGNIEYFTFDMSFPTLYKLNQLKIPISLRISEFEPEDLKLATSFDINKYWLDSFTFDWFLETQQVPWDNPKAEVFVVSPELHNRDREQVWAWTKRMILAGHNVKLCTDNPFEFEEFIYG